ncbi:MAG: DUF3048 domain-containing protein, partial [Chloroflexi bacterium]|nr:DUF3048 domain-containing protein [Chloroflexota bacterium]
ATPTATPLPDPYAHATGINPLTGQVVSDPALLQQRPLFVIINGSNNVANWYGLSEADLVYEYLMEAPNKGFSYTRYAALFYTRSSEHIGPLRSARIVNVDLTNEYQAALVASGANDFTRWLLKNQAPYPYLDVDIDDPGNNRYVWSVDTGSRTPWEDRLRTKTELLRQWLQNVNGEQAPTLRGWDFAEQPPAGQPASTIHIPLRIIYPKTVTWQYDAATGLYRRLINDVPQMDSTTNTALTAANVIIMTTDYRPTDYLEDTTGATSWDVRMTGEGALWVARDGVWVQGKWWTPDNGHMPEWLDAEGAPIPLKPGNSWVLILPPGIVPTASE